MPDLIPLTPLNTLKPLDEKEEKPPLIPTDEESGNELIPIQQAVKKPEVEHDWTDATLGSASRGLASAFGAVAKGLGADDVAKSLRAYVDDHPEFAPKQIDNAFGLITSPKALVGRVFEGAPQMAATAAMLAIPYAGIPLAAGMNYAVDAQQTYDDAIAHGAPEDIASHASMVSGVVSAGLQLIPEAKLFKAMTGGERYLAREAYAKATSRLAAEYTEGQVSQEVIHQYGLKAVGDVLKREIDKAAGAELLRGPTGLSGAIAKLVPSSLPRTQEAVANALFMGGFQATAGGVSDLVHQASYGAYLPDFSWRDFFDKRAQEALTGAGTSALLGVSGNAISETLARRKAGEINYSHPELDMFSREQFNDHFTKHLADPQEAQAAEVLLDAMFKTHADKNGLVSREKAMNQLVALDAQGRNVDGEPLAQTTHGLGDIFERVEALTNAPAFLEHVGEGKTGKQLQEAFEKTNTAEELKLTGLRDLFAENLETKLTSEDVRQKILDKAARLKSFLEEAQIPVKSVLDLNKTDIVLSYPKSEGETEDHLSNVSLASGKVKLDSGEEVAVRGIVSHKGAEEQPLNVGRQAIKQALLDTVESGFHYFALPVGEEFGKHNEVALNLLKSYDPNVKVLDANGLPVVEITPAISNGVLRGQPLFQTKDLFSFVNDVVSRTGQSGAKALLDRTGHVYVSSTETHSQLMDELRKTHGLDWKDIEATGWIHTLPNAKDKTPFFAGDTGGASMYRPNEMTGPLKFYNFNITDPKQFTIIQPKERLAQATKGSTTFLRMTDDATKAFVQFTDKADFSTIFHEMAHVLTKFSSPQERALMSEIVGREWGHWGTAEWEKIATMFETYLKEGKAPNMGLQKAFDTSENAMKEIYRASKDSPSLDSMHPRARELFDNWIDRDETDPAVLAARGKLRDAIANLKDVETNWSETENYDKIKAKYDKSVVEATNELQRAQISKRSKESEVARRQDLSKVSEEALATMPPKLGKVHRGLNYVTEGMLKLVSFERVLKRTPAGEETMQRLTDMDSRKKFLTAPFHIEAGEALGEMSRSQREDLQVVLPGNGIAGFAKISKLLDRQQADALPIDRGTSAGKMIRAYYKGKYAANKAFEDAGGYRWIAGGYQPVNAGENRVDKDMSNLRMTRLMHPEARAAFASGDESKIAPMLQAIVDSNPDQYKGIADLKELRKVVTEWAVKPDIRRSASLENGRIIEIMPTHYKDTKGEWQPMLVTNPYDLIHGTFNAEFNRVAMIEQFGQSDLQKAKLDDWKNLAKILKKQSEPDIDILRDRIAGRSSVDGYPLIDPEHLKELDYGTLKKVAKQNDVDVHVGQEEYAKWLDEVKAADFYDSNRKVDKDVDSKLRAFAKEIGGVTTSRDYAPFPDVLEEVKSRMKEVPVDLVKDLRTAFTRQGGDGKTFDTVMQLGQGIPPWSTTKGFWSNSWDVVRGLLAAAHTSMSAPFYLSQSVNALKYATAGQGVLKGTLSFLESMRETILHPSFTKSQAMAAGVFLDLPNMPMRDYGVKSVGQFIQNLAYKGLGMHAIDMVNYSLAANIGAKLAERWNSVGIEPKEIGLAKTLRLNSADIKLINDHGLTPELKAKIMQNVADNTMIYTASPVKKGMLENHPILKLLFAYNSYSTGMARYFLNHFVDDFKVSFKTPAGAASWMTKTVSTLGAFVGAGMLTQMMQQAIRGNVSKEPDEDTMKKMGVALLDIGLLGPTQRVLSAFQYDGGSSEKAFATTMPQIKFVIDTLGALISNKYFPQGKYANYDLIPRVAKTVSDSIPITRAYKQWETNVAFPESELYNKVSAETFKYDEDKERGLGIAKLASQQAENPLTKPVVLALQHYDLQGAQDAIKTYYAVQIQRLSDPLWIKAGLTPQKIQEELHSVLMSHAPLSYKGWELGDFLSHFNPQMQSSFLMADAKYRAYVNAIAPSSNVH